MLVLKRAQRVLVGEKLADAANLAVGALVFGQALTDRFSPALGVLGLVLWVTLMIWGVVLVGGSER
jgi:hypothetical protein